MSAESPCGRDARRAETLDGIGAGPSRPGGASRPGGTATVRATQIVSPTVGAGRPAPASARARSCAADPPGPLRERAAERQRVGHARLEVHLVGARPRRACGSAPRGARA